MNFTLTNDEFQYLADKYATNDPERFFQYTRFTENINNAFTTKGIDKNRAEAKEWYTKAAEQSFMEAMFTLGNVIYEDSNQEYDDLVKVHAWWNKAVLRGHDKAADAVKNIEYKMKLLEKDMPKKEPEPEEDEGNVHDDNPENVASSGTAGGYVPKSSSHRYRAGAYGN